MKLLIVIALFPLSSFANNVHGHWTSECVSQAAGFTKIHYIFNRAPQYSERYDYYSDKNCSTQTHKMDVSLVYNLGRASEEVSGANKIDTFIHKVHMTPLTQAVAEHFNETVRCGFTNWVAGRSVDVTGNEACNIPEKGTPTYSVVKVEGDILYEGKMSGHYDGRSPQNRHRRLRTELPFYRQ